MKKDLLILKLGGSIVTEKDSANLVVREDLVAEIGMMLKAHLDAHPQQEIVLIHGAGGPGHSIAKHYELNTSAGDDPHKIHGALLVQQADRALHHAVCNILLAAGLPVVSFGTSAILSMRDGEITDISTERIRGALNAGCTPVIHSDVALDLTAGFSPCSGDNIAAELVSKMRATQLVFATDVDGIFTADPHIDPRAIHIPKVSIADILASDHLDQSHNTDVTNGLRGKVESFATLFDQSVLQSVTLFNGLQIDSWQKFFANDPALKSTKITQ